MFLMCIPEWRWLVVPQDFRRAAGWEGLNPDIHYRYSNGASGPNTGKCMAGTAAVKDSSIQAGHATLSYFPHSSGNPIPVSVGVGFLVFLQ